jgi:hypothetical protein
MTVHLHFAKRKELGSSIIVIIWSTSFYAPNRIVLKQERPCFALLLDLSEGSGP